MTTTSKSRGRRIRCIAIASTRTSSYATSGYSRATSCATSRHSRDDDRMFALSTDVSLRRRCARERERRRAAGARSPPRCRRSVSTASRPGGPAAPLARLAEVDAAGELAHDDEVDAVEHLGPRAATRRSAPGRATTGRRLAKTPRPLRSPSSACSGRTVAFGSSHFGPPTAPSRTASAARAPRELGRRQRLAGARRWRRRRSCPSLNVEPQAVARRHQLEHGDAPRPSPRGRCRRRGRLRSCASRVTAPPRPAASRRCARRYSSLLSAFTYASALA